MLQPLQLTPFLWVSALKLPLPRPHSSLYVTYLANPLSTSRVISAKIFQDGAIEPPTVPSTSGSSILHSNLDGSGKPPEAQGVPGSLSFQLCLVCFSLEHNRTAFGDLNSHPNLQLCTAPEAPLLGPAPWTLVSFSARYLWHPSYSVGVLWELHKVTGDTQSDAWHSASGMEGFAGP